VLGQRKDCSPLFPMLNLIDSLGHWSLRKTSDDMSILKLN
jgi:hypothetical protein